MARARAGLLWLVGRRGMRIYSSGRERNLRAAGCRHGGRRRRNIVSAYVLWPARAVVDNQHVLLPYEKLISKPARPRREARYLRVSAALGVASFSERK